MSLTRGQETILRHIEERNGFVRAVSSDCEYNFKEVLLSAGYRDGFDYIHQSPFTDEESVVYIVDFCFKNEKLIIELDGENHKTKKQKKKDKERDICLIENGYEVIRIKTPLDDYQKRFWKNLIKSIVDEKREVK